MTMTTVTRPDDSIESGGHAVPPSLDSDLFDLDITVFESGTGLDEIIRMTDDGCGTTCESACNSCST